MNYYEFLKKEDVTFEELLNLQQAISNSLLKMNQVEDETTDAAWEAVQEIIRSSEKRTQILQRAENKHATGEGRNTYCQTVLLTAARRGASHWQLERYPNYAHVVRQLTDFHLPGLRQTGVLQSAPLGKPTLLLWGLSSWGVLWRRRPAAVPPAHVAAHLSHRRITAFPLRYQEIFPGLIPEILEIYGAAMTAYDIADVIRDLCTFRLDDSLGLGQSSYLDPEQSALSTNTVAVLRSRLQNERQRVVLDKLLEGKSPAEIAIEEHWSVRTIQGDQQAIRALRAHLF